MPEPGTPGPGADDTGRPGGSPPAPHVHPRWVTVLVVAAVALALLVAIAVLTGIGGAHGPARHLGAAAPVQVGPIVPGR